MPRPLHALALALLSGCDACTEKGRGTGLLDDSASQDDTGLPAVETTWNRVYGGPGDDALYAVQRTPDGGFVAAGSSVATATSYIGDLWLLRVDAEGEPLWSATFGGQDSDYGTGVALAGDGGYALYGYGYSWSSGAGSVLVLVKTDEQGAQEWRATYGDPELENEANEIIATSDGGFLLTGQVFDDMRFYQGLAIKVDAQGVEEWSLALGGDDMDDDYVRAALERDDGGFVLAGHTESSGAGEADGWLIGVSASGEVEWERTFGGTNYDYGYALVAPSDGGWLLAGATYSDVVDIQCDAWLVRTGEQGAATWEARLGDGEHDYVFGAVERPAGGFLLAGTSYDAYGDGGVDLSLWATDAQGAEAWASSFAGRDLDSAYGLRRVGQAGYVVAGVTESWGAGGSDGWLLRLDAEGQAPAEPTASRAR